MGRSTRLPIHHMSPPQLSGFRVLINTPHPPNNDRPTHPIVIPPPQKKTQAGLLSSSELREAWRGFLADPEVVDEVGRWGKLGVFGCLCMDHVYM